jgi:hypothetical protein
MIRLRDHPVQSVADDGDLPSSALMPRPAAP